MSRRMGARGGRAVPGRVQAAPAPLLGITGFSNGVDYHHGAASADIGAAAGFFGLIWRVDSQAVASATRILATNAPAGSSGIVLYTGGANADVNFGWLGAGGAGFIAATPATVAAGDVGKVYCSLGVWDGATILLYNKRALGGSSAGSVTPGASTGSLYRGSESGGAPRAADGVTIFGACSGTGAPSLAQYQAWHDAIVAGRGAIAAVPGVTNQHRWSVPAGAALPASISDAVGSYALTRSGSPALVSVASPTFA